MTPSVCTSSTLQNKFFSAASASLPRPNSLPTPASAPSGELVLIRGLPGSGKSTMARHMTLSGYQHFEADMFFEVDGQYHYDASRIREAHSWCQQMARQALGRGQKVVVSNTFTQLRELEPYLAMAKHVRVIEAQGKWQNVHGVPVATMERMAQRWELLPKELMAA